MIVCFIQLLGSQSGNRSMKLIVKACGTLHNCINAQSKISKMNKSIPQRGFNWDLVRTFLAALEHASLLGAARALGTSQPTVGRHIAELEAQLGCTLFERTGRGLLATQAAIELAEAARAMEHGAVQLAQQVSGSQAEMRGTVRISASQSVACTLLPSLVAQLQANLPDVQIDIVATDQVSNLLRREADIAVRMVRPDQASLIAKKIGQLGIGMYAHKNYLQRHGTPQTPSELFTHRLIGDDQQDTILKGFRQAGFDIPRQAFCLRSDDAIVQWQAVLAGAGIGFIADYHTHHSSDLVRVLPKLQIPPLPIWLAVHREIRSSPLIRKVYDALAEQLPLLL
jgi:DNA-binding transcriptional LysR family regulator